MAFAWSEKQVQEHMLSSFDEADKDKSGSLSFDEVNEVLRKSGFEGSASQAKAIFNHMDQDRSQSISKDEFNMAIKRLPRLTYKEAILRKWFKAMDKDGSGTLSKKEIEDAADKDKVGFNLSDMTIKKLLDFLAKDNDGQVDYEEFLRVFGLENASTVMHQIFAKLDNDKNGYLTKAEIIGAMQAEPELQLSLDKVYAILRNLKNVDDDQKLSYKEFITLWLKQK